MLQIQKQCFSKHFEKTKPVCCFGNYFIEQLICKTIFDCKQSLCHIIYLFQIKIQLKRTCMLSKIPNQILYSQKNKQLFLQICDLTLFLFTQ